MSKSKCWVAKCSDNLGKLFDYDLSPRFESIYDCQDYINENLKDLENFLFSAFNFILFHHYFGDKLVSQFCSCGSFIRCYHIKQKRFATGFDF